MTIKQVAERIGVEYAVASALVNLMVSQGVSKEVGKQPAAGGKGKPSNIYSIPESFTVSFAEKVKVAA